MKESFWGLEYSTFQQLEKNKMITSPFSSHSPQPLPVLKPVRVSGWGGSVSLYLLFHVLCKLGGAPKELSAVILHFFVSLWKNRHSLCLSVPLFRPIQTGNPVWKTQMFKSLIVHGLLRLLSFTPADSDALCSLTVSERGGIQICVSSCVFWCI